MVHLPNHCQPYGPHHKLQAKKIGHFHVLQKLRDNTYVFDLSYNLKISNVFNVKDLFDYFLPDDAPTSATNSGTSSSTVEEN